MEQEQDFAVHQIDRQMFAFKYYANFLERYQRGKYFNG